MKLTHVVLAALALTGATQLTVLEAVPSGPNNYATIGGLAPVSALVIPGISLHGPNNYVTTDGLAPASSGPGGTSVIPGIVLH
jgi:hypothetical protein